MIAAVELEVAGGGSDAVDGVVDSNPDGCGGDASDDVSDDIPCCRYSAMVGIVMKMVVPISDGGGKGGMGSRW